MNSLSLTIWNVPWLCSLDLSVGDLFKSGLGFLRCCGNLIFQGTLQFPVSVGEVFAVCEWDEVFELVTGLFSRLVGLVE